MGTRETAEATWERIAGLARLAPTPHNTQPFRIRPRDADQADLLLLTERLLPREDHGNRYVLSAFGIFAVALERAALSCGRTLEVEPVAVLDPASLPGPGKTIVLGRARLGAAVVADPRAGDLLRVRRTSRLPYLDREVPDAVLAELAGIALTGGYRLLCHTDPGIVRDTLRLNTDAIIDNLRLADEREEIRTWYRYGRTPEHGDGLWREPMNQPAWEIWSAFALPWLFRLPLVRPWARKRYLRTQAGTRHIALLCGPFREWPELLAAGACCSTCGSGWRATRSTCSPLAPC